MATKFTAHSLTSNTDTSWNVAQAMCPACFILGGIIIDSFQILVSNKYNDISEIRKNNQNYFDLLRENYENGILSSDEVQNKMQMKAREIISAHEKHHKITKGKDGRWFTRLPDGTGSGKKIVKTYREDLDKAIVEFYSKCEKKKTIAGIYPDWIKYKAIETSPNNAKRLAATYKKYFSESTFVNKRLDTLNVPVIKTWLLEQVHNNNLRRDQYLDIKTVLNQLLDYAVEYKLINSNPSRSICNISEKHFALPKEKPLEKQVYLDNEINRFVEECDDMFEKTGNMAYIALAMNTVLGLRVGELVALKKDCFDEEYLYVTGQETVRLVEENGTWKRSGFEISEHTKTPESRRKIPLTSRARKYLDLAVEKNEQKQSDSEFLFINKDGKRLSEESIRSSQRRVNNHIGTAPKSNHCIRKTCASKMKASGILSDEDIKRFMGHKDFKTTVGYYCFPVESDKSKMDKFESVLCGTQKSVPQCSTKIISFSNRKKGGKPA